MRGEQHNPAHGSEHILRMLQDWYYKPSGPPPGGAAAWQPLPHDIIRVQLTANWTPCTDGASVEIQLDTSGHPQATTRAVKLRDPLGVMLSSMLFDDNDFWMPSGVYAWVFATYDGPAAADGTGPYYEPLCFGAAICTGSSGSTSGSNPSGGGSGSSGSSGSGTICSFEFVSAVTCNGDGSLTTTLKTATIQQIGGRIICEVA